MMRTPANVAKGRRGGAVQLTVSKQKLLKRSDKHGQIKRAVG
jgi:hypothetical protein